MLLYLLTALFTPVLHANSERLAGAASYEAHHSSQCLPLHDEAVCPTCASHGTITPSAVVNLGADAATTDAVSPVTNDTAPRAPATAPAAARAPPRH